MTRITRDYHSYQNYDNRESLASCGVATDFGGRERRLRSASYEYVVDAAGAPRERLTDMVTNPGEMINLALRPAFAPVLDEQRRQLKEWYQRHGEGLDSKYIVTGKAQ